MDDQLPDLRTPGAPGCYSAEKVCSRGAGRRAAWLLWAEACNSVLMSQPLSTLLGPASKARPATHSWEIPSPLPMHVVSVLPIDFLSEHDKRLRSARWRRGSFRQYCSETAHEFHDEQVARKGIQRGMVFAIVIEQRLRHPETRVPSRNGYVPSTSFPPGYPSNNIEKTPLQWQISRDTKPIHLREHISRLISRPRYPLSVSTGMDIS